MPRVLVNKKTGAVFPYSESALAVDKGKTLEVKVLSDNEYSETMGNPAPQEETKKLKKGK